MELLQDIFTEICSRYCNNKTLVEKLWLEIAHNYNSSERHYHNPVHLQNLHIQLLSVKDKIEDWDTTLFSIFYHDAVYAVLKNDNEEQSAILAEKRLQEIGFPLDKTGLCKQQILATKGHTITGINDVDLFTDADLSILGFPQADYEIYAKAIRKEYAVYPDLVYNPGRKKVLEHFLKMPQLYKTVYFANLYEKQARGNMNWELNSLN